MKIAFDLDGVAWAHRELFRSIAYGLKAKGHEIGILTAHKDLRDADLVLWKARGFPDIDFYISKNESPQTIAQTDKSWKLNQFIKYKIDYLFEDWDTGEVQLIVGT